jgi:hypothetical protein
METLMSDYRNFDRGDPNDPSRGNAPYDPVARPMNAAWGWVAAAVFLVVVLAIAFGVGHQPGSYNTAANDQTSPPAARMAPPVTPAAPVTTQTPTFAPAPIAPTPNAPASGTNAQ